MTEISQIGNSCPAENQCFQIQSLTAKFESCTTRDTSANVFVNQGETAWEETRKQWLGDKCHRRHRVPEDTIISWSTTYEELLWTGNVFDKAIPLSEMVDFLVDIWQDEGLYD